MSLSASSQVTRGELHSAIPQDDELRQLLTLTEQTQEVRHQNNAQLIVSRPELVTANQHNFIYHR
jgi:hypothetical protein